LLGRQKSASDTEVQSVIRHLAPSLEMTPLRIYRKAVRLLKLESSRQLMVKIW